MNNKVILILLVANYLFAEFPIPKINYNPKKYVCYRTTSKINLDGKLLESDWKNTSWTHSFLDIEGKLKPKYQTRVKMLWDDNYFYFGVNMEEPNLWATITERDAVIFHDNDFEIFIDPDGDTHNYMELEVNAFGTEWDLLLLKPYRDQEKVAVDSWNMVDLITAIHLDGTLNDPSDVDNGWSIEFAIPWRVLEENAPKSLPIDGDQWRINFSRVQWDLEVINGIYKKLEKPEYNWVWSPQGIIAMHYPEMWGFVQFSSKRTGGMKSEFIWDTIEDHKWYLRNMYYKQKQHFDKYGEWMDDILHLKNLTPYNKNFKNYPQVHLTYSGYEIVGDMKDGRKIIIRQDGLIKVK